jgi:PAS domain S-box-containing protein
MNDLARAVVEAVSDGILVADREGTILLWNGGAERIFGFAPHEAIGRSLDLIVPERQKERHWEGYAKVVATGETRYGDRLLSVPASRKDGKRISIEFSVALIQGTDGVTAIAAVVRDVTERRERERARDHHREPEGG